MKAEHPEEGATRSSVSPSLKNEAQTDPMTRVVADKRMAERKRNTEAAAWAHHLTKKTSTSETHAIGLGVSLGPRGLGTRVPGSLERVCLLLPVVWLRTPYLVFRASRTI